MLLVVRVVSITESKRKLKLDDSYKPAGSPTSNIIPCATNDAIYHPTVQSERKRHLETVAIHGGYTPGSASRSVAVPICQTAAFVFDSADHAAALFNLEESGDRYSRISNPTNTVLETRICELEGGVGSMVVSSGQAAIHYALLNVGRPNSNIVSVPQIYGTTHTLLAHIHPSLGFHVKFSSSDEPVDLERLIDCDTTAVFCESIGNPAGNICDIEAMAEMAHRNNVPLIVDNTVATPFLFQPISYGADIVVHSLTKFLGGHGTTLGGAIVDSGNFDWTRHDQRFPMFSQPDVSYHGLIYNQEYGRTAYIARCRSVFLRTMGATLSPLSAFLLLQGIETAGLRIDRHIDNARVVAAFLVDHPKVAWVNYAGFDSNPYNILAKKYFSGRASSILSFGVTGGYEGAKRFYDALQLFLRVVNLGDVRSLACHPASTTHRQMSNDEQSAAGVRPEMIRLSIGIEHIEDIVDDLDRALSQSLQS